MSYTIIRTIHCDRCGNWTDYTDDPLANAARIRRDAKRRGWRVALPGGKDICPDCPDAPDSKETEPE